MAGSATREERLRWTAAVFGFAVISGVATQSRGALLVSFEQEFGVSESMLGLVSPVGAVGFVAVVLFVGSAAGRLDARRWLLLGLTGTICLFVLMAAAPAFLVLLALMALRSGSRGVIKALDKPLLSHLYPAQRGRMYTLYGLAWAVGATIGPLLVTGVLLIASWRVTYLVIAALLLPVLMAIRSLDVPSEFGNERSFGFSELPGLVRHPEIAVMGLSLVLIGGAESIFFTWLPYYARTFFPDAIANLVLSLYLVAYVPGRYAFSHLTGRMENAVLVLASATIVLGVLLVMLTMPERLTILGGVFVTGFFISGLFPTMVAWGTNRLPEYSGPINAVGLTATQCGFFVFPALVGVLADVYSIQVAMFVLVPLVAGLIVSTVVGRRYVGADGA